MIRAAPEKKTIGMVSLILYYIVFVNYLYTFLLIICHDSDALISDADIGGNAILNHRISSLNNLKTTTQ